MLRAVQCCSQLDDVWQEDTSTNDLEAHCASLTGKEAALFVLSGTMGNQLALRSLLTQSPHSILCDHRAHISKSEAGGVAILTSAMVYPVVPKNGVYLTLEDIEASYVPPGRIFGCPTHIISLENTLYGTVMPLYEIQRISAFARQHGIRMHCDGARLWEAVAAGFGSLTDFASCFDTVSLCFSKGLGAPVGSILVGDKQIIQHARHVRKAIGGGLRQPGLLTSAARVAVDETFGYGPNGEGGLLHFSHRTAKKVESMWRDMGGTTKYPVDTNVVWLDLQNDGISLPWFNDTGEQEGLKLKGERLVIHYQTYQNEEKVLERLRKVFEQAWSIRGKHYNVAVDANASVY